MPLWLADAARRAAKRRRQDKKQVYRDLLLSEEKAHKLLANLLEFKPILFSTLAREASSQGRTEEDRDRDFDAAYGRKVAAQLDKLFKGMGIDPGSPDAYQDAFLMLAFLVFGLGSVKIRVVEKRLSEKYWTPQQVLMFFTEMRRLISGGMSERKAVRHIVDDPRFKDHPYSARRGTPKVREHQARFDTFLERWKAIKNSPSITDEQFAGIVFPHLLPKSHLERIASQVVMDSDLMRRLIGPKK
jgi:hypothetical protein